MNTNTQRAVLGLLVVVVVVVAGYVFWKMGEKSDLSSMNGGNGEILCATDVKECPNGTYVSRTPPSCQFADCALTNTKGGEMLLQTAINQHGSALGVDILPLALIEDSRCPANVQCIQAGTVRVRATVTLGDQKTTQIFGINTALGLGSSTITLVDVKPTKTTSTIPLSEYRFVFQINSK